MNTTARFLVLALSTGAIAFSAAHLSAQPPPDYDARKERLRGLSPAELSQLEPHLQAGPVALIEFADTKAGELPGVHVATVVRSPASELAKVITDVGSYPRFLRTLDEVEIVHRGSTGMVYDWRWQISLLTLTGRNAMMLYEPPKGRPQAGYRITVDNQSGDFGKGRMSMRILPRGDREALLVLSVRLDLRTANYLARKMAKAARSMNRSANMALAYSMLLGFRSEAERRAGTAPQPASSTVAALHEPTLDLRAALPLLKRGDLLLLDMVGDRLDQVAVFGLVGHARGLVRKIMLDTDAFGSALMPGSTAKVVSERDGIRTFDWSIDVPLVGVSGRMQVRDVKGVVAVTATKGALAGGRWNFETRALSKHATMVSGWARFDLSKSSWFLRALTEADPYLAHGMSAASQVMLMRALRSRTKKLANPD